MLNTLEGRLENANSLSMKEKHETEIKKEIKKLQQHRNFFKQLLKDNEVKDKSKISEARRLIEEQMEKFRELEKEYKSKKLTKVTYQNHNELESKFIEGSSDNSDAHSHQDCSSYASQGESEPEEETKTQAVAVEETHDFTQVAAPSQSDKDWFNVVFAESIRKQTTRFEQIIAQEKQQKPRKKQKQSLGQAHLRQLESRLQANNQVLASLGEI